MTDMGVRPPATNDEEPNHLEFGIAALDARLDEIDVSFPVTAREFAETHGDMTVPVDADGHELSLSESLERCEHMTFDSEQELLNALHPVFESEREAISNSLLGRIRSLSPF